ncbi:hypothetical protein DMH01_15560 [Amycolatopsis sp. WAC 04182]|uniref:hypothetical protein n=1 Tax=Amycolatopsis sp. WAC 04182 TaxID=2203198 RepID=UPI000F78AC01|nr:hypothetical protein [Amycolatopsis sp. WAC 04182]RSN60696.1 hypothetical protein DMH01_15560 [Amycolatopsis sp. WAC 04182]
MSKQVTEQPEDAWNRITGTLVASSDEELWQALGDMADYRGGDPEKNLTLAALVHTLADRDDDARQAFESWKQGGPDGEDSGHIVAWMQTATGRMNTEVAREET